MGGTASAYQSDIGRVAALLSSQFAIHRRYRPVDAVVQVAKHPAVGERWQFEARCDCGFAVCGRVFSDLHGLQFTSASRLTVFLYTSPFWVAVLVPLWVPAEKIGKWQWAGLILAFCGVTLALFDGFSSAVPVSAGHWKGDLLALAGGLGWGLTTVVIRTSVLAMLSAEKLLFYQIAISAVLLPVVSLAVGESWHQTWSSFAISSMLIQTILGAFISYLAWMWLIGRYPATKISGFVFLTPLFALLVGSLWLGEALTLPLISGLACVAVGMLLVNRKG